MRSENGIRQGLSDVGVEISIPVRREPFSLSLDTLVSTAALLLRQRQGSEAKRPLLFRFHWQEQERRENPADPATILANFPARLASWGHLFHLLRSGPAASVAVIEDHLSGEAFELALACDRIVIAQTAGGELPQIGGGTFPFLASYLLPVRAGLAKSIRAILCQERIGAAEGVELGLFAAAVAPDRLEAESAGQAASAQQRRRSEGEGGSSAEITIPNLIQLARELDDQGCCRDKVLLDFAIQAMYQGIRYRNDHRSGLNAIAELLVDYLDSGHYQRAYLGDER
jgi:enoyl-CoA hydratase/carnithine racemase